MVRSQYRVLAFGMILQKKVLYSAGESRRKKIIGFRKSIKEKTRHFGSRKNNHLTVQYIGPMEFAVHVMKMGLHFQGHNKPQKGKLVPEILTPKASTSGHLNLEVKSCAECVMEVVSNSQSQIT